MTVLSDHAYERPIVQCVGKGRQDKTCSAAELTQIQSVLDPRVVPGVGLAPRD